MRFKNTFFAVVSMLLLMAPVFIHTGANAQNVDITLVDDGSNNLEVRLRPDAPFDGIVSNVVFTIRWNTADAVDLGTVSQVYPEIAYMFTQKSGDQWDDSGYRYQIFSSVSLVNMSTLPHAWTANTEYSLLTIPVLNGSSSFEIVNDGWTAANNGDFFVSLGGVASTGVIYPTLSTNVIVGSLEDHMVNIVPNPSNGEFMVQFTTEHADDYTLEVVNSIGQIMFTQQLKDFTGVFRSELDLSAESNGLYFLKIAGEQVNSVHRIVVE